MLNTQPRFSCDDLKRAPAKQAWPSEEKGIDIGNGSWLTAIAAARSKSNTPRKASENTERIHTTTLKDYAATVRAYMRDIVGAHFVNQEHARREAFDTVRQIVGITHEVFGGPVQVTESFDPEYPDEKHVVFIAEVAGDNKQVLALESQWRQKMRSIMPKWDDFRILVKRKK